MNTSSYLSEAKELNLTEEFYLKIGSTWIADSINMFLVSPIGFIGFVLNFLSFRILLKINIRSSKLYDYLRVYTLNSLLICFILTFWFIGYSPRLFIYFNTMYAKFFRCGLVKISAFYIFGTLLDIIIAFERLSIFIPWARRIISYFSPYKLCGAIMFYCILANTPFLFTTYIRSDEEFVELANRNLSQFTFCGQTSFYKISISNPMINLLAIANRDILTLIFEVVTSVMAVYYFKRFRVAASALYPRPNSLPENTQIRRREENHRRLLLMTILMSFLSMLSHFMLFIFGSISIYSNSMIYYYSIYFGFLFLGVKHSSNFFLFYMLNSNFKNAFLKNENVNM